MFHLLNGRPSKSQPCAVTTLVFLLLMQYCRGQSQMVGPSTPIVAILGGDIIVPSHLEPAADVVHKTLEWSRPDLKPRFVHVRRDGVELLINQNPSYVGRTSVTADSLKHGDVSLKLSKVRLTDAGTYRCHIPEVGTSVVKLIVGALSSPVVIIARIDKESSTAVLQCEAEGWYPEPELFWLDGEGNLLSAGPTETVRGPDDLYTVSSTVTVRKSDSFTCRVQQKNITQTRETEIQILEDVFTATSCSAVRISVFLSVVGCLLCSAALLVCCKLRNNKRHTKMHHDNNGPEDGTAETDKLVEEERKMEDQKEEKLKEKEEEQNDIRHVISVLEEKKKELENSRDKLMSEIEEADKQMKKNEKKLNKVKTGFRWDQDDKMKELLEVNQELENKKTECKKSLQTTVETLSETDGVIQRLTGRRNKVEEQVEEMKKQLTETKRQRDEETKRQRDEEGNNTESSPLTEGC